MTGLGKEKEEKALHVEAPWRSRPLRCGASLGTRE